MKPYRTNKTVQAQSLAAWGFVRYVQFCTVLEECRHCTLFILLPKKFLNLGEGLNLLFKDSSADKEAVFKELFFTSKGRLNRKSYIYRSIFLSLVLSVIQVVLTFAANTIGALELLFAVLLLVSGIFGFVAGIMMLARRLHDLDKSGWWMLLFCVPLVNILFYIYILFFKGIEGPNQYGEDPLQQ